MLSYIIIHHTHETFEVALFVNITLHRTIIDDKRLASKTLIFHINALLQETNTTLNQLSFIGINQGPGLFSTLRSIITTVNALHFSHSIPLIGIDALEATLIEFQDPLYPTTIALLDAFNHEIYYGIQHHNEIKSKGYDNIEHFLHTLNTEQTKQTRFIGYAAEKYQPLIKDMCKNAFIPEKTPLFCSINIVAMLALKEFYAGKRNNYLFPLYLKKHPVEL